ncbi:replication initiation negative regulator SeqA [Actinobacillus arthritidis]|uniref:replication initiation negative regulator SeqA n=1 Tax=Actinobacillus arthritidis TaxID=157339 RepID=UPI00244276CB|nr:replication initiation negative regulator SeqA [Actinobacillus arthritidis]WGE89912.1 replication initiation negative regulator SeqA [Actinobacillus arthritidis]
MKTIEIDDELYHYIASRTQAIGESASDILRRLLRLPSSPQPFVLVQQNTIDELKELAQTKAKVKKEDLTVNTVHKLEKTLKSDSFINESKNVMRFLMLLSVLHQADSKGFAQATEIVTGTERTYFATSEAALLSHGSSVKAKQIPDSPFWVVTNNNTARKGLILTAVMESMSLPKHLIERVRALFA